MRLKSAVASRLVAAKGKFAPSIIFRNDEGAIDLASIMVGVIVIGIIAGVIAATVFAVIPWSQDQAADQKLDAVKTAESVQYAQSAATGAAQYLINYDGTGKATTLESKGLIQHDPNVTVITDNAGKAYIGLSVSATGNRFYELSDGTKYNANKGAATPANVLTFASTNGITTTGWDGN